MRHLTPLLTLAAAIGAAIMYANYFMMPGILLDENRQVIRIVEDPHYEVTTGFLLIAAGLWLYVSLMNVLPLLWLAQRGARRDRRSILEGNMMDEYAIEEGLTPTQMTWRNMFRWLILGIGTISVFPVIAVWRSLPPIR